MQKTRVKKRSGVHKRHLKTKDHLGRRVARFLPALLLFGAAYTLHNTPVSGSRVYASTGSVLAYATSLSIGDLQSATNAQRAANGVGALALNGQLNAAAQSKANDMATRNYWSHNTPEGQEPWIFFSAAGYSYTTAGENLAYGFSTSADTVTGWMNSPPHKANLLNTGFRDVGFGFANSDNYQGNGQQTIVVAMYGATGAGQPVAPSSTANQHLRTPHKLRPQAIRRLLHR